MSDDSKPAGDGPDGFRPLPAAEALAREMAQRREWAQRPDTVAWEQLQVWKREQREREKAKRQRPAEMVGPPNPYQGRLRS
ncbi:MAG: hypothetical protein WD645_04050 [Dehalococcoidia bacterium]